MNNSKIHLYIFVISMLVNIETAIGQGTVSFTNAIPETWIPGLKSWCLILAFVGSTIVSAVSGYQAFSGGSAASLADIAKKTAAVLIGGIVALFLLSNPAEAQGPKPIDGTRVLTQIVADAQAALEDAKSHNDDIAAACYSAIATVAQARLNTTELNGGLLLGFQKLRDVTRLSSSPIGTSLIIGCAPLVQDAKLNFLQFFTSIGASVLLKGLLIP